MASRTRARARTKDITEAFAERTRMVAAARKATREAAKANASPPNKRRVVSAKNAVARSVLRDDPYDTRLNILHDPNERIDVQRVVDAVTHPWFNQTLCRVNESVVRLGVVKGEYHWH